MNSILVVNGLLKTPREAINETIERVKSLRIEQGYTQEDLAERAGIPFSTYRHFEQTGKISLERLLKVAMVLGDPSRLIELFPESKYQSLDEVERLQTADESPPKRAGRKGRL
ncbi:helix-turn-helix domain-containing protein [Cerasicoccus arenae]|uniref:HTH cro/C1-type domain-containing protein n=1 Tax=Cerasicoccus arenae TaxID=424488 RepID=A0A8J3GDN9_9BACT|nr:helix-turn-helix transcriptional regulator [Cerasicoccus arenae]MBK1857409.1 helix-turn-helix transcriptional regulator [Cerasicoccus arenae]GHC07896.1 hypothetical protein GCM10007047_26390 [Cerasicoccus arenae]